MTPRVGIVVPTLGKRPDYLTECLESIRLASKDNSGVFIVMVAPGDFDPSKYIAAGLVDQYLEDPKTGLPGAINAGIRAMPEEIKYVNWLGDDDLLAPGAIDLTSSYLDSNPDTFLVFGGCDYLDSTGRVFWQNKSGSFAVPLLRFGPDLIPQPGSLFRRESFMKVGGLNLSYNWAFDFDLFIRFSRIGKLVHISKTLSSFRWHSESLSVKYRAMSAAEASRVRTSHLPAVLRVLAILWEYPLRKATILAGNRLTAKARGANQTA